ncbi:hypothetical protein [Streptomyces rubellomurinus]|uniref:hypothetical protein n=1 Tax=Streptomyces rubellomurinus (strain ATCC 31215) TaxID=359131 RepID=UPI0012FECF7C|nr:hypothetical protein [Streptomyces rubellomurinus]
MSESDDAMSTEPGDEALLARLADAVGPPPAGVADAAKALFASMFAQGRVGTAGADDTCDAADGFDGDALEWDAVETPKAPPATGAVEA